MNPGPWLVEAAGIADAAGRGAAPGALLIERAGMSWPGLTVLASGSPEVVAGHDAATRAQRVPLPDCVLLPGLVNAHCHLDLTAIGPTPYNGERGFAAWLDFVRANRPQTDAAIAKSVRAGVEASLAGGVAAVGDIAGEWSLAPLDVLRDSPLRGVSFVECFGLGERQAASIRRIEEIMSGAGADDGGPARIRLGLQPHAPYSAGPRLYRAAAALSAARGLPVATHLAESLAERQLLTEAAGPLRDLLESLGLWSDDAARDVVRRAHPVAAVLDAIGDVPLLAAHVNDAPDDAIARLARSRAAVVYCPRASAYFGHERALGPHPYREMAAAGVPIALGTDSPINIPAPASGEPLRLSTLDEMRFLWRRDDAPPDLLLSMATTSGAAALGLAPSLFDLAPGPVAGVIAVPIEHDASPTESLAILTALKSNEPPRFL